MADEDHMRALHWLPESDRWEDIPWDQWLKFREWVGAGEPLPGISAGIHYFVVCIHDDGVAVNVIPQKYMIDPDGKIGRDNFAGLTRQEREDYQRPVVKRECDPGDQECIDAIHAKMGAANDPPSKSLAALKRLFPKAPEKGSLAEKFFRFNGTGNWRGD